MLERAEASTPRESAFWTEGVGRDGNQRIETGSLVPGKFDLFVRTGDPGRWWVRRIGLDTPGVHEVALTLPPPHHPRSPTGSLYVELDRPKGERADGTWIVVTPLDDPAAWERADRAWLGSALFAALEEGRYRVAVRRGWHPPFAAEGDSKDVTIVASGHQARVRLALTPRADAR